MIDDISASIRKAVPPIHREGRPFIAIFAAIALVLLFIWQPLGWIGVGATIWCALFFRDPNRVTPMRDGLVVSGADGVVCDVKRAVPPPELGLGALPLPRVAVFMNVFDVHVNRAPVAGTVTRVAYTAGKFFNADLDKASEDNERNGLVIQSAHGPLGVVQIAGLVARRIVCFVREGETIGAGERFGLIRFGSRVDHYLPEGVEPLVGVGQRTVAGETVIADLTGAAPARTFRKS
ncbi:phosphatidylserine decarboxylase [Methylopila capsulata]|uniref:Phosphatidylserine decarboxylase proenzyme n=1 Tax=Methylopila capsulata TaxID=61654 RepID=A0A9W6MU07_9HYPH|nr:phosphatidylserine decarboxylase [Methylopila capsulata]MBM7852997.1 phosphatidylserine decarboxylase [Methylopila capsulata]GLK57792.1 phosphatidylserine decarboxylase proenzyme [Methylopila capsulata]